MQFTKMHGIGNDYVYVNGFEEPLDDPPTVARAVSDRNFGIGADGLILILPSETADVRMRMFNSDGSEGQMCGNGIRCVAKFAHDHGLSRSNPLRVETLSGIKTIDLRIGANDRVEACTVDMGEPILDARQIPVVLPDGGPERIVNVPVAPYLPADSRPQWASDDKDLRMTCVSMGNPHMVVFCDDLDSLPFESAGPCFETLAIFPDRINVHFVEVLSPKEVRMRTWERGSGETLACGTGASAVAVATVLTDQCRREVLVHLPGGDLHIHWRDADGHVLMTGPATEVFSGEWFADSPPAGETP